MTTTLIPAKPAPAPPALGTSVAGRLGERFAPYAYIAPFFVIFGVFGLFGFVTAWNDFPWPFIVLKSPERYTAQIAIKALRNSFDVDLGLAMSGSFLATIPLVVLFAFVGKRMVAGILDGAFKG